MEIEAPYNWLASRIPEEKRPVLALILGSGWGPVVEEAMTVDQSFLYNEIPGFPVSTVEGHRGRLLLGHIAKVPVWVMQGRFHYYEGYGMGQVTLPIRVFARLGVKGLLLTNAAGGMDPSHRPGDLMVIRDHINCMGANPLRGPNAEAFGPRFPDLTEAWDKRLQAILQKVGSISQVDLHCGVYLAVSGPTFETPAEIKAFRHLGADAVGMSTVPECIVARHCGIRVAGLSCITNLAAHEGGDLLTHEEVAAAAAKSQAKVVRLLLEALPEINRELETPSHAR